MIYRKTQNAQIKSCEYVWNVTCLSCRLNIVTQYKRFLTVQAWPRGWFCLIAESHHGFKFFYIVVQLSYGRPLVLLWCPPVPQIMSHGAPGVGLHIVKLYSRYETLNPKTNKNIFFFRLRDDVKVCTIIDDLVAYLVGRATSEEICRVYLRKVESVYYKVREWIEIISIIACI